MSVQPADGEPWMTEGTDPQPTAPLTMSGAHEEMLRRIVAGGTGLYSENVRELFREVDALRAALAAATARAEKAEEMLAFYELQAAGFEHSRSRNRRRKPDVGDAAPPGEDKVMSADAPERVWARATPTGPWDLFPDAPPGASPFWPHIDLTVVEYLRADVHARLLAEARRTALEEAARTVCAGCRGEYPFHSEYGTIAPDKWAPDWHHREADYPFHVRPCAAAAIRRALGEGAP